MDLGRQALYTHIGVLTTRIRADCPCRIYLADRMPVTTRSYFQALSWH